MSEARVPSAPEAHLRAIADHGDREAFAALFVHFAPRVRAYLIKSGCERVDAEELVQEAMLAVWRKAPQFDPARADAAAWIFAIARNLRIDSWRRRRDPAVAAALAEPPEEVASPLAAVTGAESAEHLRAALADLPPDQRAVVRAVYFDDRPHTEVAEGLGIPLGTVKSRLRLAMRRMRAALEAIQ